MPQLTRMMPKVAPERLRPPLDQSKACDRLRITAEGKIRNCLFSTTEWDARALVRGGASDDEIANLLHGCVDAKKAGHGIDDPNFVRPERAMYQIGG